MAASNSINQRIILQGADEVRRHLEEIGKAGERSGNQTRAALQAATGNLNSFTAGAKAAGQSSGQMRFALQNLSFQVNDVATSLASGGDVMRVFAQQGGQVFQVFQQGGGFGAVMRAAGSAIASFITPTTAAVAGIAAVAAGFAILIARAASAEGASRKFDVILQGMHKNTGVTGKQLEQVAEKLHDVGISAGEARPLIDKFLQAGGDPRQTEKVLRTAADLQAVLGTSIEESTLAFAKGGPEVEEYAKRLGLVTGQSKEVKAQLDAAAASAAEFDKSISAALQTRSTSIADAGRDKTRQFADLATQRDRAKRVTGDPEVDARRQRAAQDEDIETASARRIEDINREHAARVNEIIAGRNAENTKQLAAYNQTVLDEAQKALDTGKGILDQISQAISGANNRALSPFQQAIRDLSTGWNSLLDTLAKSETFTQIITDLGNLVRSISDAIKFVDSLVESLKKVPGLPASLGGSATPGFAAGTTATPPGTILVGERGPELITQPGGLSVWSNQQTERLLSAFNALNMPVMPRARRFAAGTIGAGSGGGSRTPINLTIGGETFGLESDDATAQKVIRFARKRSMLSAGRKPSTA